MACLEVREITKTFGSFCANSRISFKVDSGQVLAVLGENGAGKTVLMKIISGLLKPDQGEVFVDGQPLPPGHSGAALQAGICMIHQHFMLIPRFTVWENVVLGREPRRGAGIDRHKSKRIIAELSERFQLKIDADVPVEQLTVGQQQRVEILKAFYRGARILILDEPTAMLTPQETGELFSSIRRFAREGLAVVFISHKISEVLSVSDQIMVMRQGQVVEIMPAQGANAPDLARSMVGRDVVLKVDRPLVETGDVLFSVKDLVVGSSQGNWEIGPLSLHIRSGEILGIAGVDGNGQMELTEAIVGLRAVKQGTIELNGERVESAPVRSRLEKGIRYVPADRHSEGLVLDANLVENMILRDYYRPPFRTAFGVNMPKAVSYTGELLKKYDVRPSDPRASARQLSGGNQQKLVLAREMGFDPRLFLVAQPTRGLDVGAIEFVHKQILELRSSGTAVLLISLELEELLTLTDRIAVMFRGKFMGTVSTREATLEMLGLMMAGQMRLPERGAACG